MIRALGKRRSRAAVAAPRLRRPPRRRRTPTTTRRTRAPTTCSAAWRRTGRPARTSSAAPARSTCSPRSCPTTATSRRRPILSMRQGVGQQANTFRSHQDVRRHGRRSPPRAGRGRDPLLPQVTSPQEASPPGKVCRKTRPSVSLASTVIGSPVALEAEAEGRILADRDAAGHAEDGRVALAHASSVSTNQAGV